MNISSRATYTIPYITLFLSSYLLYRGVNNQNDYDFYLFEMFQFLKSLLIAAVISVAMQRILFLFHKFNIFKYLLLIIPLAIIYLTNIRHEVIASAIFVGILSGILLYSSYISHKRRCVGTLTDDAIYYKNLFNDPGIINLTQIEKIEQIRNFLSVFRRLSFLTLARRTNITFRDENHDAYVIQIFTKVNKENEILYQIISNANKVGNTSIKQYAY
ncbi:hypothetical protein [Sphingobacterium bovistauri]|uniref:Uncharacterized protein n=1 Tax=Sphingobacterium bovistauri TaxID=2781959 RepID=A0ABS7Z2C4_9SPHI|nr:hypothetical protein [Sphingobacterium bovistauri]MCA5003596.1 hypothetical protein [Sphingobacterium bovistauri]